LVGRLRAKLWPPRTSLEHHALEHPRVVTAAIKCTVDGVDGAQSAIDIREDMFYSHTAADAVFGRWGDRAVSMVATPPDIRSHRFAGLFQGSWLSLKVGDWIASIEFQSATLSCDSRLVGRTRGASRKVKRP
jgi:hypothetical protein